MLIENELLLQVIKYAIAGGIATLVHILVFHLAAWKAFPALQQADYLVRLLKLSTQPAQQLNDATRSRNSMISNMLAFVLSTLTAYVLNILWVFEPGRHSFIIEIGLFYVVSGISILISTLLMGVLIKRFGVLTTYAFIANIVSAASINYGVRKYFIFLG